LFDHRGAAILISASARGLKPKQKEQETMMKEFLKATTAPAAALLAALAFGAMATPASAAEFCRTDVTGHMTSCSYVSMAQCQAASAGIGGDCFRDPYLNDSKNGNAYAYHPESPRSRRGSAAKPADTNQ
jgi:uncharacterized membrane protein